MQQITRLKDIQPLRFTLKRHLSRHGNALPGSFWAGMAGFTFYCLAFAVPIIIYGANALFVLLYTWPFFLALMPLSVLIGMLFGLLFPGRILGVILLSGLSIFTLFWLVFSRLTGW